MSDQGNPSSGNDKASDTSRIARWTDEITLYEKESEKWDKQAKRILERYKDYRGNQAGRTDDSSSRFNVLWANTQTLQPALYAKNPKADIQRRFKDADPIGRVTSDILERCVSYFVDTDEFAATMRQCVTDYLLPGRGTTWNRYVPHMHEEPIEVTDDVAQGEDAPQTIEVLDYEEVVTDFVHREDFGHNICRTWDEVWLVWRRVYMTRAELVKRFGEEGRKVPLDYKMKNLQGTKISLPTDKAVIYEAWDKKRLKAVWFHKTMPDALDERDDPLKLDKFFPCPKPLFVNLVNDSLIPTPIYVEYQDQAIELDNLTARIASITKAIKFAGVYDASAQGIGRLLSEGVDNQLIAVESWAMFAEKGGIKGAMDFLPIEMVATALLQLYQAREQVKGDLYEITGIPDIVRGQSDANETLGAQQIKTSFATNRISDMQRDIQRFVRENIRIMVDIICNHFQLDTIKRISGVRLFSNQEKQIGMQMVQQAQQTGQMPQLPPGLDMDTAQQLMESPSWEDVQGLIKDNAMRCFRIDIETDSTIKADEEADKASATEFLKALGGFLDQAVQAGASQPALVPFLMQSIMFYVRRFPVGKELEGALQTALTKLEKAAQQPPPPNPEMQKVQGEQQLAQAKMQSDSSLQQQKIQGEMQLAQTKMQNELQIEGARIQAKQAAEQAEAQSSAAIDQRENELEALREHAKLEQEERLAMAKIAAETDLQLKLAHIKAASAIEVARITAKADTGDEAEAREVSGE